MISQTRVIDAYDAGIGTSDGAEFGDLVLLRAVHISLCPPASWQQLFEGEIGIGPVLFDVLNAGSDVRRVSWPLIVRSRQMGRTWQRECCEWM